MLSLLAIEFKRARLMLFRYPMELLGQIVMITLLFYGLFLGALYIAGPSAQFGARLDALVVGYVLWTLALFAIGQMSWGLMEEAREGTLEQVFLSPYGPVRVYLARNLAGLLINLALNLGILFLIMALTGARVRLDPLALLPLIGVMLASYGVGFALGAMALFFKRIQAFLQTFQFVLMFLIMTPFEQLPGVLGALGALLPLAPGVGMMRGLMARGEAFDPVPFAVALANGLAYFLAGIWVFSATVRVVKRRGMLGGY